MSEASDPLLLATVTLPLGLGAGVIQSSLGCERSDCRYSEASFFGAALIRTIRGLPERTDAGDTDFSLAALRKGSGLGCDMILASLFSAPMPLSFRKGEDLSMTDASSPSIAFASALNFIGGTGTSSSELSPIENFQL